ncbi:MAG TPA: hypothetical protein VKQ28_06435 [Candidatus Acidoferrum sp.]|nr:hypothetical protein [Candidatus Acidoferrum sp.]
MARKLRGGMGRGPALLLKLTLIENSYNFLNQSLQHYRKTSRNVHEWPFTILHITQSIELMLKHVLRTVHPTLVFEDVDHPKRTVTLEQALNRLANAGIAIGDKEKLNIARASKHRNLVVHYEFELDRFECKNIYAQLFEFVHFFHLKHLNKEIHGHIQRGHWPVEARLMAYFDKNFVVYNGVEMYREHPSEIIEAQSVTHFEANGQKYERFKYGDEPDWLTVNPSFADIPCHDCGVVKGQYHAEGCDGEECPECRHQLLGCGCF